MPGCVLRAGVGIPALELAVALPVGGQLVEKMSYDVGGTFGRLGKSLGPANVVSPNLTPCTCVLGGSGPCIVELMYPGMCSLLMSRPERPFRMSSSLGSPEMASKNSSTVCGSVCDAMVCSPGRLNVYRLVFLFLEFYYALAFVVYLGHSRNRLHHYPSSLLVGGMLAFFVVPVLSYRMNFYCAEY